jgi:hypothetical protein
VTASARQPGKRLPTTCPAPVTQSRSLIPPRRFKCNGSTGFSCSLLESRPVRLLAGDEQVGSVFCRHRRDGALSAEEPGISAGGTRSWCPSGTGAIPEQCRNGARVARKLQASCKPVAGLLEAFFFSLPPGPQAQHRRGPAREWRCVPQSTGIWYRLLKGCPGYTDWTDFKQVRSCKDAPCHS